MLSINADAKTSKGISRNILTGILYLSPADTLARIHPEVRADVCPWASEGCRRGCLNTAGRGAFSNVQKARAAKTLLWHTNREEFYRRLTKALTALERKAKREGFRPAARLDGTSDLFIARRYVRKDPYDPPPAVQLYDYTKSFTRMIDWLAGDYPSYHLTYSRSEDNGPECLTVLRRGGNVAAVFASDPPAEYQGFPVHNGDGHDARFLDPAGGYWIGLKAKGRAKHDRTGFVIRGRTHR